MQEKQSDTVKVSDWSQKYKLAIYAISGIGITFAGYKIYQILVKISTQLETIASLLNK